MGNWIQRARQKLGLTSETMQPGIQEAIELVLDHSCPKIRLIRGYQKRIRQPVESALNHIAGLIDKIPGPLEVTSDSAIDDVLVKSFFLNRDQLRNTLAGTPDVEAYLPGAASDTFFVLLTMGREVKTIFGARQEGEILLRDVAMEAIQFSDHKFRVPSPSMAELKDAVEKGLLQILAHWALESILEEQSRKEELSLLREELKAKLNTVASERQRMVLQWRSEIDRQPYAEAQKMLERIENELNAIKAKTIDAGYYLGEVSRVMTHASDYLTAEKAAFHFDRMGIPLDGKSSEDKADMDVLEIKLGDTLRRSCVFLKCSRKTLFKK
jgi:hypothetical protein